MNTFREVPKTVIKRLPMYLRVLDNLVQRDIDVVLSRDLSDETGFTAELIRKDLAYFGAFGTRGNGYNVESLRSHIMKIIGLDETTSIVVVGIGHLGNALSRYNSTKNPYVNIVGLFDTDPKLAGETILDMEIRHTKDMQRIISENDVKVAMITVPADAAQEVADRLVEYGITAILNFAPVKLQVPNHVYLENVYLAIELQSLIYYIKTEKKEQELDEEKL